MKASKQVHWEKKQRQLTCGYRENRESKMLLKKSVTWGASFKAGSLVNSRIVETLNLTEQMVKMSFNCVTQHHTLFQVQPMTKLYKFGFKNVDGFK